MNGNKVIASVLASPLLVMGSPLLADADDRTTLTETNPGWQTTAGKSVLAGNGPVECLYDNGPPDGVNGYSNGTINAFGARRTLLDDFTVPEGETWIITDFHWRHVWGTPGGGNTGTGAELSLRVDLAGTPGDPFVVMNVTSYDEMFTGEILFEREEAESWVEFDPIELGPGTYWFEGTVVGPENNFWLTAAQQGNECWVNYDDLGGFQSGTDQFGVASDLNWCLTGEIASPCPCPEDIDRDGQVAFSDILRVLAAWGPCEEGCGEGGRCNEYVFGCGGNELCTCVELFDGSTTCQTNWPCGNPACPDGNCPPDFHCVVNSCCQEFDCVPDQFLCDNPANDFIVIEPGVATGLGMSRPVSMGAVSDQPRVDDTNDPQLTGVEGPVRDDSPIGMAGAQNASFYVGGGTVSTFNNALGWFFTPLDDVTVNELGNYDHNQDGLRTSHRVGIFRAADASLVAGTTIQAGTASTLEGESRFEPIAPVTLTAGTAYYIIGTSSEDEFVFGTGAVMYQPEIQWDGSGGGDSNDIFATFTNFGGQEGNLGPNFRFGDDPCGPCPEDIDKDGQVAFSDILRILAAWGPCEEDEYTCSPSFSCEAGDVLSDFPCNGEGCFCFTRSDGTGFCQVPQTCSDLDPCDGNGECPPGFVCVVDDCCGFETGGCVPIAAACETGAPMPNYVPGTMTQAGLVLPDGTFMSIMNGTDNVQLPVGSLFD